MASDPRAGGGFVRVLVAIAASMSLVGGLAVGAVATRWYSLRHVGTDATVFVPTGGNDTNGHRSGPCSNRPCNFLLLGSDSRSGLSSSQQTHFGDNADIGGTTRADTIMLVHTDPQLKKAIVLSFPRDLWVNVPGHGMDKINSAFEGGVAGGGPQLMAQTITNLTGLGIDHYLYVDLQGFQDVVNKLDGVEMCIPAYDVNTPGTIPAPTATGGETTAYANENGHVVDLFTGLDVLPGCQHLDGTQALAYVRSRHLPCDLIPDFSRIGRQQQFMRAIINQMLQPAEIAKAPGLVGPVLASLHRDSHFYPGDLINLVGQLRGVSTGAVEFRSVPGTPTMARSLSVVKMDPSAKEIFAAIAAGRSIEGVGTQLENTAPSEANTTVQVIDAGNPSGAAKTEDVLLQAGFDVSPGLVAAAAPKGVRHTVIAYAPGQRSYAQVAATYFPGLKLVQVQRLASPVAIVVFPGFEPNQGGGSNQGGGTQGGGTSGGAGAQCPTTSP
jgi:anionic cell wall polymer biosynthesis LytR-Cps2A-Psr (LCP) family protein